MGSPAWMMRLDKLTALSNVEGQRAKRERVNGKSGSTSG